MATRGPSTEELREHVQRQLASLDSGITGFRRLFSAIATRLRTELGQLRQERDAALARAEAAEKAAAAGPAATPAPSPDVVAVSAALSAAIGPRSGEQRTPPNSDVVPGTPAESAAPAAVAAAPAVSSVDAGDSVPRSLLVALVDGVEQSVGPAARAMAFAGGRSEGLRIGGRASLSTMDLAAAVAAATSLLADAGLPWSVELSGANPEGLRLRGCLVPYDDERRQAYQGGPLCQLMCGVVAGALESLTGVRTQIQLKTCSAEGCDAALKVRRAS